MEQSPEYEDILDDETLAPLKRNHACLQVRVSERALRVQSGRRRLAEISSRANTLPSSSARNAKSSAMPFAPHVTHA